MNIQRTYAYVKKFINHKLIDVDDDKLNEIFKDYDFIAPRPSHYKSVRKHFEVRHNRKDIPVLMKVIKEKFPEYLDSANKYFEGRDEYLYNMFIFSREDFLVYSKFMFDLIEAFCLEKNDKVTRMYLSERITGLFITHLLEHGKKAYFLPVLHVRRKLIFQCIKQSFHNIRHSNDRSILLRMKPVLLCLMPRHVEQRIRRHKAD